MTRCRLARRLTVAALALGLLSGQVTASAAGPELRVAMDQVKAHIHPGFYGLMTEEINFAYEGGLYGELVRNRSFKAEAGYAYLAEEPVYWDTIGSARIALDKKVKLNDALDLSLALQVLSASADKPAGIRNGGYWGIPVRPDTDYRVSFHARAEGPAAPLTVSLVGADGAVLATGQVSGVRDTWQRFELTLRTGPAVKPSKDNHFTLTTHQPGTLWLQQVSVFGPTFKGRRNGLRPDLMELMGAMRPKFLRFPGGNYVEGDTFAQRFDWKKTIGDVAQRPGHRSPWNYWSTDGMGMLEFLLWCKDLGMEPLLNVFAGYALNGERLSSPEDLAPYVQDALDQIEYIVGGTDTTWGARRARDGHPEPFAMRYVEIGNEDFFDRSGSYDRRFAIFYRAIKAKYPHLQLISSVKAEDTPSQRPDLVDDHVYAWGEAMMYERLADYDRRPRSAPKVFVGEWATHSGWPMPTMKAAIADAAFLTSLERNADVVQMAAYAPLLANVSQVTGHSRDKSMQWATNLIGYDALRSYGTPSYHVQKLFAEHLGDVVLVSGGQDLPTWTADDGKTFQALHWVVTRKQPASGPARVQIKFANRAVTDQPLRVRLDGARQPASTGTLTVIASADPDGINTLDEPLRIAPKARRFDGIARDFILPVPALSAGVLEFEVP